MTHRGEGHTIYAQGNACIDDVVNAYLLTLAVPAAGTTCGNGPPPPSQSAGPTPTIPTEADPTATAIAREPTRAPAPPSTGDSDDGGGIPWALVGLGLAAGAVLAGSVFWVAARRRTS